MKQSLLSFKFLKTAVLFSLLLAIVFAACSKNDSNPPPPPDKTALQDTIDVAQSLYDGTVEGTKPGQYEVGSKAALQTAIDAGTGVVADAAVTQAQVTSATANVHAAIETYKSHLIKEISAANLMGFWKFNGNPNDSSGNGRNGVATQGHAYYGAGNPTLTADRFGRSAMAYHFDNGGNIEVPFTTSLNPQQMSISLWCKKSPGGRTLNADTYTLVSLDRWYGYKLQYQLANKIFFTVRTVRTAGDTGYVNQDDETAVLDNETWYHVVVTFKPGEMNFYINGDLVKSWTGNDAPGNPVALAGPVNFVIGQDLPTSEYSTVDGSDNYVNWGGFFSGDIDDVMFYNVVLDGPQVKSIFENQKSL